MLRGALGPVASGYLLGHFWFGSIFLVNVPIILIALVSGAFLVPKSRDPEEATLDPVGAVLSIIGIVALVYGLIEAPRRRVGEPDHDGCVRVGGRRARALRGLGAARVKEPMLDMHYFRNPAFSTGTGGMILVFLSMYGVHVPDHPVLPARARLQRARRPRCGTLPIAAIMIVVAPFTPRMSARWGANRAVAFGMLAIAAGFALFAGLGVAHARTPTWWSASSRSPTGHRAHDVADDRVDHGRGARRAARAPGRR